jgi:hypothetical protein
VTRDPDAVKIPRASYSQLTTHRVCPQRWRYSYDLGLEKVDPDDVKVERDFGNWWQALLASYALERGRRLSSLQKLPKPIRPVDDPRFELDPASTSVDMVLAASILWWEQQTPLTMETWDARLGEALPIRLGNLFERWRDRWVDDIATEEPLTVELGWGRDLPPMKGPDGIIDPRTRLVGYIDEVYFDTRRRIVVVRDNKSHKSLSTQTTADDMMDSQLQFYAWGAALEISSWGRGKVMATAYDRVRSVRAKIPAVTQSGTLGKTITDFDLATYVEWARGPAGEGVPYPGRAKDGSGAGLYQAEPAVIERLSSPASTSAWFQRTLTPLNANLIKVHLRAAVDSSVDLELTKRRMEVSGEAARNLSSSNCRWCDFALLCRAEMVGGVNGDYELADYKLRARPS